MKIDMKQPILDKNDAIARELRERFAEHHVYVVDLLARAISQAASTPRRSRRRESPPCRLTPVGHAIWKAP